MKIIAKGVLLLMFVAITNNAYSICVQSNNELVSLVGLDSKTGLVYAGTTSASNECSCSEVRFKPENTDTKMALSILLSAKMASKKVRIDLLDTNDCNSAYRVYVQ